MVAWRDEVIGEKRRLLTEQMQRAQAEMDTSMSKGDEIKERMSRFMIRMTGRQQLHQAYSALLRLAHIKP